MTDTKRYPASIRLIARVYNMPTQEVGPMLVRWRTKEQLTYQQITDRLAAADVELSVSRVAAHVLDAQGDSRPPMRPRPWRRKDAPPTHHTTPVQVREVYPEGTP